MNMSHQPSQNLSAYQRFVPALGLVVIGITLIALSLMYECHHRSNVNHSLAWLMSVVGCFSVGAGISFPFVRLGGVIFIGFVSIVIGFYAIYWIAVGIESRHGETWFAALDVAKPTAPYVTDFRKLFPGSQVRYRYFTPTNEPGFDLTAVIYGRYELTMQLPVEFNSAGDKVIGYGEPDFYLGEAVSVDGRSVSFSSHGLQFGSAEWKRIVEHGGDFQAIGYTMIKDRPITGLRNLLLQ